MHGIRDMPVAHLVRLASLQNSQGFAIQLHLWIPRLKRLHFSYVRVGFVKVGGMDEIRQGRMAVAAKMGENGDGDDVADEVFCQARHRGEMATGGEQDVNS